MFTQKEEGIEPCISQLLSKSALLISTAPYIFIYGRNFLVGTVVSNPSFGLPRLLLVMHLHKFYWWPPYLWLILQICFQRIGSLEPLFHYRKFLY